LLFTALLFNTRVVVFTGQHHFSVVGHYRFDW
jgi:hypothetical protein